MLSKKSPRKICRIGIRNYRTGVKGFLNQRCVLAPDLESILRTRMRKIVFRQHRPAGDPPPCPRSGCYRGQSGNLMLNLRLTGTYSSDQLIGAQRPKQEERPILSTADCTAIQLRI